MENPRPIVGITTLLFKDGKILLGKRKGSHGAGTYGTPGGKLDFGEVVEECTAREVRDETGLEIKNIKIIGITDLLEWQKEGKQFLDIGVRAEWKSGEPELMEPEKCEGWDWYDPEELPSPLFGVTKEYLKSLHTDHFYFGAKR